MPEAKVFLREIKINAYSLVLMQFKNCSFASVSEIPSLSLCFNCICISINICIKTWSKEFSPPYFIKVILYFLYHLYICICIHPFICILFSSEDVTEQPSSCLPVHPPPRPCPLSSTHLLLRVVFLLYFLVFLACLFRLVSVLYFFQMTTTTQFIFINLYKVVGVFWNEVNLST